MVGQRLGHYKIVEMLGAGGMGEVYRAHDTTLDREVALKILPTELASDPDRLARFQREAKTLAALDHPNIITIHSVEEFEGLRFLTMQLVEGKELAAHIPASGMPLDRIFEVAVPLAEALTAAHDRGIVHRDLKPGNIMITAEGRVKVLDFGLAKLRIDAAPSDETALPTEPLTQEGLVLGTVPYMSPEQLEGLPVDARSDIFALGVILYEMATGKRPFTGANSLSIVGSILRDNPSDVDALRPELPHHLGRIVRHCLEKDPKRRFQSTLDVQNELGDLHQELTSGSTPSTIPSPEQSAPVISQSWKIVGVALALILLVFIALWLTRGRSPPPATQQAESQRIVVLPFENLGPAEDEYFADGMTEEITSRLASVPALQVISRTTAMQYKSHRPALSEIGDELGVAYALEGTVRWAQGADGVSRVRITPQLIRVADDTHLWSQSYDRVLDDIFLVQSELAKQVLEQLDITLSGSQQDLVEAQPTENLDAYQAYLRGRYLDSLPHFSLENWNKALASFERAVELDPGFALAWGQLSRAHARLVYYLVDASVERLDLARQAADRAAELAPDAPETHLTRGYYFLLAERDAASAERHFEIAARTLPDSAAVLEARGEAARLQGHMEEALDRYRRAAELSPLESSPVTEMGLTYWWSRRYSEALKAFDRAIALAPDQMWPYLGKTFNYWSWKGVAPEGRAALDTVSLTNPWGAWTWYWQVVFEGRHPEALATLDALEGDWIRIKISGRPKALYRAYVYELSDQPQQARKALDDARSMLEAEVAADPDDPRFHSSLGIVYAMLGRKEEAIREGRVAVELFPVTKDAIYATPYAIDLAHIFAITGEHEAAIEQLDKLLQHPGWISTAYLMVDPRWNPLTEDPDYQALLARHSD